MSKTTTQIVLILFISSICLAFVFAIVFVITLTITLPGSDGAFGQTPFQDPLVFPIMSIFALVSGIVVFPFIYFFLRNTNLQHSLMIVTGVTIGEIVLVTPFSPRLGLFGSYLALLLSLIMCKILLSNTSDTATRQELS